MILKPFFSFFGSKFRVAKYYPQPFHNLIIEPFCGSAGYSLNYPHHEIRLYDLDPLIYWLWEYLIKVKESEILSLPNIVDHVDEHILIPEQKWLIGFNLNKATTRPRKSATDWAKESSGFWSKELKTRIASQLKWIRHWKIFHKSYKYVDNRVATWFIDPPYQYLKSHYVKNEIDYKHLGSWCQERSGQTIVCEQLGANWLPFKKLTDIHTTENRSIDNKSSEVIWYRRDEL